MEELTIEELLNEYPYLKKMEEYTLFTSQTEVKKMRNSDTVKVGNNNVSIEFLKKVLNDEKYYEYCLRYFKNEIDSFQVTHIISGDAGVSIYYTKSEIIRGILNLILDNQLKLTSEELEKYENLRKEISFEKFIEENKDKEYNISIDGKEYVIPIENIITFLNDNVNNTLINQEHFTYASYRYFIDNKIIDNYLVPAEIIEKLEDIRDFKTIDVQAINKHLETKDTKYKEVNLNKDLENLITSDMPLELSNIEKAIYIYIKLCKVLTYDDEYYAVNQEGSATKKHQDISYLSTINPTNNRVVCFEFNLIYSHLLSKLGINFKSDYKNMVGEVYGTAHANLEFRCDKFLIQADSVTSILLGDMTNAKLNQPLKGLKCINKNENTKDEFNEIVSKIYNLIVKNERKSVKEGNVEYTENFNDLVNEYLYISDSEQQITIDEKISMLLSKLNSKNIEGIDYLSYIIQLRKVLFTEDERKNNIGFTIIRDNEAYDYSKTAMSSAILTINKKDFLKNPEYNLYYYLNSNTGILPMSKSRVQENFDERIYEYISEDDPVVPGIEIHKSLKR